MSFFVSALFAGIAVVLVARALRQQRAVAMVPPAPQEALPKAPSLAIVVPARNEADNVGPGLSALLLQDCPGRRTLIMVDDHSRDATATTAREVGDVRVVRAPPLPPGWVGKPHACWVGARAAPADAEWLCFVDADVRADPALLRSAVAAAEADGLDLLSLVPRQVLKTFPERLLLPCGFYLLAFSRNAAPFRAAEDADATASGPFLLIRREFYERAGGHAAVGSEICEDVALARAVKRVGGRIETRLGDSLLSTRMYAGWRDLWEGVSKNLVEMLGGPLATALIVVAAVPLAWGFALLPIIELLLSFPRTPLALAALALSAMASAAAYGLHLAGSGHFGIPRWYGLLFPVGYTVGGLIALDGLRQHLFGHTGWKGRVYRRRSHRVDGA